jgi:hypothetical protein
VDIERTSEHRWCVWISIPLASVYAHVDSDANHLLVILKVESESKRVGPIRNELDKPFVVGTERAGLSGQTIEPTLEDSPRDVMDGLERRVDCSDFQVLAGNIKRTIELAIPGADRAHFRRSCGHTRKHQVCRQPS